jgi:hypothetical protein
VPATEARLGGVAVAAPALFAGADRAVPMTLPLGGTWDVVMAYTSALPVEVTGPGLKTTMVPNLDRPGPRFPVGSITIDRPQTVQVRLRTHGHPLSSTAAPAQATLIAVPRTGERLVPLREACGQYVDYFTLDS